MASGVGISPSLLSQVETGKTQPSVSTLYALVSHLGLSIDDLLGNIGPRTAGLGDPHAISGGNSPVQRHEDSPVITMENGVTWERLATDRRGAVDPIITTYAPGGASSAEGKFMRHSGTEYGYLLSGELTLKLDFDTFVLRAGDSLCFDSHRPHLYVNHTDAESRGVWFVVDPDESPEPGRGESGPRVP